ncbi:perlucin-like isoform X1 [Haliotis rufescens]|uniref:perlucin-like isoform X1 n=1 Tax=Haliotis rufescens TaxID=6454 RepID=UPI001EAFB498|nr:perlucin-like isoform X1 [Haliotis rufescens]
MSPLSLVGLGLLLVSASSLCPEDFTREGESCYKVVPVNMSWADGWMICKTMQSFMVEIDTSEEQLRVFGFLQRHHEKNKFWTGGTALYGNKQWTWMTSGNAIAYTNWIQGQPDNSYHSDTGNWDTCLALNMNKQAGWSDEQCEQTNYMLCEADAMSGSILVG